MRILSIIVSLFCMGALSSCQTNMETPVSKIQPNIIFIFADDLSYNVIATLGNDEVQTPHIDSLMDSGTTFTHSYNMGAWGGAVCAASRTMLNTGYFLWKAHHNNDQKSANKIEMNGEYWSQYMKKAGYETYFTGKWHVRIKAEKVFDNTIHIRGGMPNQTREGYNRPIEGQKDKWSPSDKKFDGFWKGGKHWSEVLADDSVTFIEKAAKKDKPFFMYLAFNAAHDPRQSPKEYVDRYPWKNVKLPESFLPEYPYKDAMGCPEGLRDEALAPFPRTPYSVKVNRQEYYAIINHMDDQIARIIKALKKSGKFDNTYIIFTSDHGLSVGSHGLIGKQSLFDHSIRVPFSISGPNIKKQKISTPIYLQDIMPTTLEWAGFAKPKQVKFKSLVPLLNGESKKHYSAIYGAYRDRQRMVIDGNYKLIIYPTINKTLLFNLKSDPLEMKDIAKDNSEIVKNLKNKLRSLQGDAADTLNIK